MTRVRLFLVAIVVCSVCIGGFLAGRVSAQQVLPSEDMSQFVFPRAWGEFRTVQVLEDGQDIYFFEAVDGTIRKVSVTNGGNTLRTIQIIQRSGAVPQRGVPGTLR
jgi:hypothetical protein